MMLAGDKYFALPPYPPRPLFCMDAQHSGDEGAYGRRVPEGLRFSR